MAGRLEWKTAQDHHDACAQHVGSRLRERVHLGWRESRSVRHLPGRHELQSAFAPADSAGIGTQRLRMSWSEVAPGKTLDRRAASRRHIACRSRYVDT